MKNFLLFVTLQLTCASVAWGQLPLDYRKEARMRARAGVANQTTDRDGKITYTTYHRKGYPLEISTGDNSDVIIQYTYESDTLPVNVTTTSGGKIIATRSRQFDDRGNIISDKIVSNGATSYLFFKYNQSNLKTDEWSIINGDSTQHKKYLYNSQMQLIRMDQIPLRKFVFVSFPSTAYEYGHCVREYSIVDNNRVLVAEYKYDESGDLVQFRNYGANAVYRNTPFITQYKNYKDHMPGGFDSYNGSGKLWLQEEYKYGYFGK